LLPSRKVPRHRLSSYHGQWNFAAAEPSSHNDIKELPNVPLTDFWNRWRRKLPQPERQDCAPTLREAEKRRSGATRQVTRELATIVTMPPRAAKPQDSNTG
jgi:hypothetical protein